MIAAKDGKEPRRSYSHHALNTLRRSLRYAGNALTSRRYKLGRLLWEWRQDLIRDLGGEGATSTQQLAVIDLAVKTKLLLDSIDAWLLTQPSLIDKRRRAILPVVRERQALADALARYMGQLGLERRVKPLDLARALDVRAGAIETQGQGEMSDDARLAARDARYGPLRAVTRVIEQREKSRKVELECGHQVSANLLCRNTRCFRCRAALEGAPGGAEAKRAASASSNGSKSARGASR